MWARSANDLKPFRVSDLRYTAPPYENFLFKMTPPVV